MTHKKRTLPIAAKLDTQFICTSLNDNQPPRLLKFGLFLIDDIIDNLGDIPEVRSTYFEKYYAYLMKYCTHPTIYVRHAAVYGLGSMAKCVKAEFLPLYEETLTKIVAAIDIPLDENSSNSLYNSFCDNAKAAFGKVIESVMEALSQKNPEALRSVLKKWISYLPLKYDKDEAVTQHDMLLKILTHQEDLIVQGEDAEVIRQVLTVFIMIYTQKTASEGRDQLMQQILLKWGNDNTRKATMDSLNLDAGVASQLKAIIGSQ